eukprot:TRINITY_DN26534_c0_g1_i1.p1 TRINITY_DN26534_c0_g1~~TRINITY_DN26534_c0_g1_i1.p1  ORF type:complete len:313 (+),score=109.76 TRINITY_DN26534_c0_g1_i1:87-1025(+)
MSLFRRKNVVEKKEENVKKGLRRIAQVASHLLTLTPKTQKMVVKKIVPIVTKTAQKAIKNKVNTAVKQGESYIEDQAQNLEKIVDQYSSQTQSTLQSQLSSNTPLTHQAENLIDSAQSSAKNQLAKISSSKSPIQTSQSQSYVSSIFQGTLSAAKFAILTSLITATLKNRHMLLNYWNKTEDKTDSKQDMSSFLRKVREDVLNTTSNVLLQKIVGRWSSKYAFMTIVLQSMKKGSWTESMEYVMMEGAKAGMVKIVGMFFGTGTVMGLLLIGGTWYLIEDLLDWLGLGEDKDVRQKRALDIIKKPQIIKSRF